MERRTRLSIVEYMRYLGGTACSRCVYEGQEVLNAGHVILCGKLNSTVCEKFNLCALCLQTSALNSDPHKINGVLTLTPNGNLKISNMFCSCKAGNSGTCKHISAVLIKCTRDLQNMEIVSQTDLKCVWSIQKSQTREKYKPIPLKDMPCFKTKILPSNLNIDDGEMYNFFCHKIPNAAISLHRNGRRQNISEVISTNVIVVDHFTAILDNADQSILMMELHSLKTGIMNECCSDLYRKLYSDWLSLSIEKLQLSKDWYDLRKYRVTGSRIYELYTYSKADWNTKSMRYFYPKTFSNKYVKHGLKYEIDAKETLTTVTDFEVSNCGIVIPHSNKWLGYSPDGIIMQDGRPTALLEIKCLYEGATSTIL